MFSLDEIRVMDSFQFLDASLEVLMQNLVKSAHKFKIFEEFFKNYPHRNILKRKGIFPYSYFDCLEKLEENSLPPRNKFYNVLTGTGISEQEYRYATRVFKIFNCKSFGDYLKLYQNLDVVTLAEIFSSFRKMCFKNYSLDPVHYISAAEYTWDAGLRYSKVELQLLDSVTDYIWFESQMRGGICLVGKRYALANSPYLKSYDPSKPDSHILALDVTNLYGYTMGQPLPTGNFSWLSPEEVSNFNILNTRSDSDVGYILEVDLLYPENLHALHDDLPLAVEHLTIRRDMLSKHAKNLCEAFNLEYTLPCKKLVPNLFNKNNYITHYLNLKFYVEQGLIIKKIHKILAFSQSAFLKSYIQFNNSMRQQAKNDFEKTLFKKMNNAFYGKTCQNVRKRINVKASLNSEDCKKHLSSPLLEYFEIVNENFTLFKMLKPSLELNKPIFCGFTVLELSKLHVYQLWYLYFKNFYKHNINLLYMDTDSFIINIRSSDLENDLNRNFDSILDRSNFPEDSPLFSDCNKGKLGYLKFEVTEPIEEFIALQSKVYAYSYGDREKMRAKGVRKSVIKNLNLNLYKEVLFSQKSVKHRQHSILATKHNLNTVIQNKTSLTSYYDKRYLINNLSSNSYGHCENEETESSS